jgi:hypothetical protein
MSIIQLNYCCINARYIFGIYILLASILLSNYFQNTKMILIPKKDYSKFINFAYSSIVPYFLASKLVLTQPKESNN